PDVWRRPTVGPTEPLPDRAGLRRHPQTQYGPATEQTTPRHGELEHQPRGTARVPGGTLPIPESVPGRRRHEVPEQLMNDAATDIGVVIVGAGFGGLAMAIELRRAGIEDFVVLEKASDLGGVWRENTYPGAGCDVPSPLYSFSFAHNARWPRRYAGQAAIHAYLARTAREYGVIDHIRFDVEVTGAEFDDHRRTWLVHTDDASRWHARVFVPAPGQLSRPAYPRIPGTETFRGPSFHSAQWRHDVPLRGRRVAVIGTGASAVQFVPHVQADATRLTVFQRSPPYILPKRDHSYDRWPHRAFG